MEALDIDNAVSLRLLQFETETAKTNAKLIAYEVSKIFGDGGNSTNDSEAAVW